ncbi:TonB-dependent receptor [Sphingopyxis panaciterrulae]|uniref:TonB-dependent receptor n=1 Tax=Sphingopyxis panaciterrulae TaxID=462372 RepID=A0A7W9EQ89_9SPHN|nr:TonB-dependent receptor [Sphingopyxis panaciterrulae]MBB5706407.1 TonB-dependent receptor [Sphingopyxis panaciterrulae]
MTLKGFGIGARLRGGVSLAVLAGAGLLVAAPAAAQDAAAPADETAGSGSDIVVVGVRSALQTAQERKKNAETVVDSIDATDIGAFPDNSVSSALQRVPGITVSRLQSTDDSTHPSGEPAGVLIRGLTFVRTEVNGRDSFSADSYRGLNFNDISPELMARIDAYKNQTADMIEGGIAGTVDLRTRLPFDEPGLIVTANAKATYGDRSDKWNGEFSALISKTFDTPAGRFGLMADYARSHVVTRTESVIMDKIRTYCSAGAVNPDGSGVVDADGSVHCDANPFGGTGWAFAPDGIRYSQVDYDRTREGIALAGQYESPTGDVRASVQFIQSTYHNAWLENASHAILEGTYFGTPAFNPVASTILRPQIGSSPFVFGADGMLESGLLTQAYGSWRGSFENAGVMTDTGSAVPGQPFVSYCPDPAACTNGMYFQNEARNFDHREKTRDLSANLQWDATDRLHVNFDAQWIKAKTTNDDILVATGSMADYDYSVNKDGTPEIRLLPGSGVNYADGGLANPHNYWMPFIQAHLEDNDAEELALKADVDYEFEGSDWIDSLKVGVRYSDREQNIRYSSFNWTPIAASWNCNGPGFNVDNSTPAAYPAGCGARPDFQGYGAGLFVPYSLGGGFYNGSAYDNGDLVYLSREAIRDRAKLVEGLAGPNTSPPILPGWSPICDRAEATVGCFTPPEVMKATEKTKAAYAMLRFGGDNAMLGGVNVRGNIGVRIVRTDIDSTGSVGFPQPNIFTQLLLTPCGTPLGPDAVVNPACYLTDDLIAFADGSGTPNNFKASYTNVLPSLNVRFGLDDHNFVRFGYSRAMARPDFGLLRNYVSIQAPLIDTSADSPFIVRDGAGNITGYNFIFRAESGFAGLKPVLADQFDLTFEHYRGATSFHADIFYKKLRNTVSYGEFIRSFDNGGSEQTVVMRGPRNVKDGGELYGLEAGFQTFFDFLPGLLSGLGMQANYTLVEQSGISNSNLATQGALDGGGTGGFGAGLDVSGGRGAVIDSHRLAGISKHTFNIVGLYEKGPVALRLAYNWRSRFLTNNLDCCIGLPVFQKPVGFLDGSIRFSPTPWLELSIEGQNLLNTTTVYQQQIFGDTALTPGAKPVYRDANWGRVDRRFQFGARVKF